MSGQEIGPGARAGTVSNNLGSGLTLACLSPEKAFADSAAGKAARLVLNADTGVLVWGQPSLDITPDVVKELSAAAVK